MREPLKRFESSLPAEMTSERSPRSAIAELSPRELLSGR